MVPALPVSLEAGREAVEQGAFVLVGRCYDLTETPPYGPWVELFGQYEPSDSVPLPDAVAGCGRPAVAGPVGPVASLLARRCLRRRSRSQAAINDTPPNGVTTRGVSRNTTFFPSQREVIFQCTVLSSSKFLSSN